ncbi:MAG TPA: hypothetical protein DCL72_15725 [Rhizobiales bacterium]|jgi:hypothetical protein|nr:hypothetical protein [Hyphomicrobiales bacterium]
MTAEFHYRGFIIKATPMASSDGGWTHDGLVEEDHLAHAVDDHVFRVPGKSATRDEAVKVVLVHGKLLIDNRLA